MIERFRFHPLALLFLFFHLLFIVHLYGAGAGNRVFWGVILFPFYFLLDWKEPSKVGRKGILYFVWMNFGLYGTLLLQGLYFPVLSAALTAVIFSFTPLLSRSYRNEFSPIVYAGCFAGMAAEKYFPSMWMGLLVSIPGTVIYLVLNQSAQGIGGKLGTIGFASLIFVWLWYWI